MSMVVSMPCARPCGTDEGSRDKWAPATAQRYLLLAIDTAQTTYQDLGTPTCGLHGACAGHHSVSSESPRQACIFRQQQALGGHSGSSDSTDTPLVRKWHAPIKDGWTRGLKIEPVYLSTSRFYATLPPPM